MAEHICVIGTIRGHQIRDLSDPIIDKYAKACSAFNFGGPNGPKHPGTAISEETCPECGKRNQRLATEFRSLVARRINAFDREAEKASQKV